jgi:hypothetical protein
MNMGQFMSVERATPRGFEERVLRDLVPRRRHEKDVSNPCGRAVVHVADDGTRTVIVNRLTGGAASVDVSKFSGAGSFEVSTSSELSGTLMTVGGTAA